MKYLTRLFLIVVLLIISFSEFLAIPAFARKYKMSCQTCHAPFPKLKTYGDEFAGNGFRLAEQNAPRYFLDTGDEELSLIRDFPLAMRLEMHATYRMKKDERPDLGTPYLMKLLSGGELTQTLSYYFYFYISERGELVGIEDAFLMFNNLFDQDLDLYLGQFQVCDPLFKRELRLTLEDYQIYKTKVGNSTANLAYDRGIMLTYGLETGTDIIIEIVNGNGIGQADEAKNFDDDKYKNFFGRISQDFGEFARVGAFGYLGKENIENEIGSTLNDEITMWGPDITLSYKDKIELNMQYSWRSDTRAFNSNNAPIVDKDIKTRGAFAELLFTPKGDESKWYIVGLYNWVKSDFDYLDYKSAAFHFGFLYRRNFRMVAEYKYDLKDKYSLFSLGFVSAF